MTINLAKKRERLRSREPAREETSTPKKTEEPPLVDLLSETDNDPAQDPHDQARDDDSISLSKIPVQDLSDLDADDEEEFLCNFYPKEM